MAAFKARKVYEATGLPCIASRTSFEVEPIPPSSGASTSSSSSSSSSSPFGMPMSSQQQQQQSPAGRQQAMTKSPRVTSGYRINDIGMNVEYLCDALRPMSEPTRVTRFRTCLCFYDGEMEIFEYGVCDVDLYFASSMRTFIAMASAINGMLQTLQLTFGLEYQKFLKDNGSGGGNSYAHGGPASMKLRDRVLKDGKVLPNDIIDVSTFMDSQVDVNLMDDCARELVRTTEYILYIYTYNLLLPPIDVWSSHDNQKSRRHDTSPKVVPHL
jgi:hypothetical protein